MFPPLTAPRADNSGSTVLCAAAENDLLQLGAWRPSRKKLAQVEEAGPELYLIKIFADAPTSWTILQHDGPHHLGLWCNTTP